MTTRDHLLRTLAAVAPGTRVVVSAHPTAASDLARLGLDVWACDADTDAIEALRAAGDLTDPKLRAVVALPTALGYPDAFAAWGVLDLGRTGPEPSDVAEAFAELSRVVALGGWLWLRHPDGLDALLDIELPVGVVPAEAPHAWDDGATVIVRRVDDTVVA